MAQLRLNEENQFSLDRFFFISNTKLYTIFKKNIFMFVVKFADEYLIHSIKSACANKIGFVPDVNNWGCWNLTAAVW